MIIISLVCLFQSSHALLFLIVLHLAKVMLIGHLQIFPFKKKNHLEPKPVVDELFETATSTSMTISWTKPEGDLTGYRIDYKPIKEGDESNDGKKDGEDSKDDKMKSMKVDKDTTKADITGLESMQLYQIDIYTVSGQEESMVVTLKEKTSKFEICIKMILWVSVLFCFVLFCFVCFILL